MRRDEQGAALIIALAVLTVFGLWISALLANAEINLMTTSVVRDRDAKVYAADGGIEHGIQELRQNPTLCASDVAPFNTGTLTGQTINGRSVEVTCETKSGFTVGALGYAVITHEELPTSLQTQSGGGGDREIDGPTYASGISDENSFSLINRNGSIVERASATTCDGDEDKNDGLTVLPSPPNHYRCLTPATLERPDPPHALPAVPPAAAPAPIVVGDCTTFFPGTYSGSDPLYAGGLPVTARNYMVSGTYYFNDVEINVDNEELVGGQPSADPDADETMINHQNVGGPNPPLVVPCDSDAAHGVNNGTGVKLIMGGNSAINVENKGSAELFNRCPPPSGTDDPCDPFSPSAEGVRGFSFMTVPLGTVAGWIQTAHTLAGVVLPVIRVEQGGTNPQLAFHGLVYVPHSLVEFMAVNSSNAQIRAGIVAGRLLLQSSASATGLVVSVRKRPGVRQIIVTATANGVEAGDRDVIARAVIKIRNNAGRTVTIDSWHTI